MNLFRLVVSWQVFLSPFIVVNHFTGYSCLLGWWSWSFRVWNALLQALVALRVFIEKQGVILMEFCICVTCVFSLAALNTLSLFCVFSDMLWGVSCLGLSSWVSVCDSCICIGISFPQLGEIFFYISLKSWSMPLAQDSQPSSMIIIRRFGLSMVSYISCMFLSSSLIFFHILGLCCLIPVFYL